MTSKWIEDAEGIYADGGDWIDFEPLFERIDKLLREAKAGTEDENLHDRIEREINGTS